LRECIETELSWETKSCVGYLGITTNDPLFLFQIILEFYSRWMTPLFCFTIRWFAKETHVWCCLRKYCMYDDKVGKLRKIIMPLIDFTDTMSDTFFRSGKFSTWRDELSNWNSYQLPTVSCIRILTYNTTSNNAKSLNFWARKCNQSCVKTNSFFRYLSQSYHQGFYYKGVSPCPWFDTLINKFRWIYKECTSFVSYFYLYLVFAHEFLLCFIYVFFRFVFVLL